MPGQAEPTSGRVHKTKDQYRVKLQRFMIELPDAGRGPTVNWAAAAVALGMTTSVAVAGEPRVLSDPELATITAAGVLVDVTSIVAAFGAAAGTRTDAMTSAFVGEHVGVGVGVAIGQAFACCGQSADVEVGSVAVGIGNYLRRGTRVVKIDGPRWKHGFSASYVVAISFEGPFAEEQFPRIEEQRLPMLEELRAALADFRVELPDAARSSALSREALAEMVRAHNQP
jgi:uncharacterized protein (DUF2126 family)